jgi:putative holliday junction resolvase
MAPMMERVFALDVGTKTIGIAVSDPLGITAQPVDTIRRTKLEADLQALRDLVAVYDASRLVVGYPRNMDGSAGAQAQYVDRFVAALQAAIDLPVELVDERLTTRMASQAMKDLNVKAKRRKEIIDQQAAVVILQTWLDSKAREAREAQRRASYEED